MRLFLVLAAASLASAAKLDKTYLPPNAQASAGSGSFLQTPLSGLATGFNGVSGRLTQNAYSYNNGFPQNDYSQGAYAQNGQNFVRPERPRAALERNAAIVRQYNQNNGDNFEYAYETENGIYAEERGVASNNGVESQGGYTYTADDGQVYSIRYTAGENGFVPQGDHLPTSPPVPEEILKALEQNARDEAAGIFDDGSYNEAKYGDNNYNTGSNYNGNYNGNVNAFNDDSVVTNSALFNSGVSGVAGVSGFRAINGLAAGNGLKSYLPPVVGTAVGKNAFGRRASFNARDGYQY